MLQIFNILKTWHGSSAHTRWFLNPICRVSGSLYASSNLSPQFPHVRSVCGKIWHTPNLHYKVNNPPPRVQYHLDLWITYNQLTCRAPLYPRPCWYLFCFLKYVFIFASSRPSISSLEGHFSKISLTDNFPVQGAEILREALSELREKRPSPSVHKRGLEVYFPFPSYELYANKRYSSIILSLQYRP